MQLPGHLHLILLVHCFESRTFCKAGIKSWVGFFHCDTSMHFVFIFLIPLWMLVAVYNYFSLWLANEMNKLCSISWDKEIGFNTPFLSEYRFWWALSSLLFIMLCVKLSRDFDAFDLRMRLPAVVSKLHKAINRNGGVTYVHCTAGLGRAPATAVRMPVF